MTDIPAPLTPPECDLQDFPFMPLHVARLRDSDLAAEATPEACWYAVLLWAASWHQLPAASLPDNEAILTKLLGLGRDVRTFRKHKATAMRGFVLCSDGRLYHPVVAEQALTAWQGKLQQRWRTECARIKKQNQRTGGDLPMPTFEEFLMRGEGGAVPDPGPAIVPGDTVEGPSGQLVQEKETGKGTGTGTGRVLEGEANASLSPVVDAPPLDLIGEPVVPLAKPKRAYPPPFEFAWKAYPHHDGRSSKPNALVQWRKLPADEQVGLVEAIGRFKPHVERVCGGKGAPDMARWLKDGKHLTWLEGPASASTATPAPTFAGPAALRLSVVETVDEAFAVKFIDPAGWRERDRTLIARNVFAAGEIERQLRAWLIKTKVRVEVAGAAAAAEPGRAA